MSGLEILGALASSIAIVQAVQGTLKAIDLLREIGHIQQQCDALKKEIVMIEGFILDAKRHTSVSPNSQSLAATPEPPLISLTVDELQAISKELDQIVDKFALPNRKLDLKRITKKIKWVAEVRKIEELRRRAQNTKSDLHMAISFRTMTIGQRNLDMAVIMDARQEVLFRSVRQCIEYSAQSTPDPLKSSQTQTLCSPQIPPQNAPQNCDISDEMPVKPFPNTLDSVQAQSLLITNESSGPDIISVREETSIKVMTIQPLGSSKCGQACQCRCHSSLREYNSGAWLRPLLGSWLVKYSASEGLFKPKCSEKNCDQGSNTGIELEYWLPAWVWAGVLSFKAHACGWPGLSLSLRPSRTFLQNDDVWDWVANPSLLRRKIGKGLILFPDDADECGRSAMEYAINFKAFETIEILLAWWANVLPDQGLSRGVGYSISHTKMFHPELKDSRVGELLRKTRSFVDGGRYVRPSKIHRAVGQGELEMLRALREQPWAINEFDEFGMAPIHWAVRKGDFGALELLLEAKADVNRRDWMHQTPLMWAQFWKEGEITRALLKHKDCRRQINYSFGRYNVTALHFAVYYCYPEGVSMLLEAGASPNQTSPSRRTPLHLLHRSNSSRYGEQEAQEIVRLLQEKEANLDAQDFWGWTPVLLAVKANNLPILRALYNAGASVSSKASEMSNILHLAAEYADAKTLDYLVDRDLTGVDPKFCGVHGCTPLGLFYRGLVVQDEALGDTRRPSLGEQEAFLRLYFGQLSRHLQVYLLILKQLLGAAVKRDTYTSSHCLSVLIKENKQSWRDDLVGWYQGILGYVKDGNWDPVIDIIFGEICDTYDEMDRVVVARSKSLRDPEVQRYFRRW